MVIKLHLLTQNVHLTSSAAATMVLASKAGNAAMAILTAATALTKRTVVS